MKQGQNKIALFLKRNSIYLVMALCILAIGFSIIYMAIPTNENVNNQPDVDVSTPGADETPSTPDEPDLPDSNPTVSVITFILPVEQPTSIGEFSETMVWSSTLSRFSAHMATDFFAPEGTNVLCVYDGTVESVENSLLHGYTVTVDHGNGLKTVYNSLSDGDAVVKGQSVKAGDILGQVSVTNRQEYKSGAHLHFEVLENGVSIDPIKYLDIGNK